MSDRPLRYADTSWRTNLVLQNLLYSKGILSRICGTLWTIRSSRWTTTLRLTVSEPMNPYAREGQATVVTGHVYGQREHLGASVILFTLSYSGFSFYATYVSRTFGTEWREKALCNVSNILQPFSFCCRVSAFCCSHWFSPHDFSEFERHCLWQLYGTSYTSSVLKH